ncbi:TRAP transporter substrate-binding protein [Sunxiuqinia elliptica]|uniref:Tripartite ATP-independent transporter DctP family solute receptor n=1 Tax=Sunxiuqinia elliptica TaxID=655355 RepID=A0A4R6GSI8_9BACT|nr:TRAP transporter substrate-binding protein [Sunxiuqinia elliptica]TDN98236.1 tripartite ATP-independent transporter DctP family solute receptor [Sunxiuqinia elliptica]TDO60343.1 tripartite ATP-independent transporter DctP family solute receptor [Sunxiuqinia elliptica]
MTNKGLAKLFLFVVLMTSFSCMGPSGKKELKLAHGLPVDHPVHQAMEFMAKRTAELSDGKLTIEVYPAEQLGSEQQCVELLQIGSLAITKVSAAVMESFTDDYKVFGLPYIFRSKEHSFKVMDGEIGKELLLSTQNKWIRGLCYYDAGSRSFYTKSKPITHPDDLAGMKIRVMRSITAVEMTKALGGSPTPISWGELYTALQSGVVDGAENNPPSLYTSRHYEVCKFYSLDEHTTIPDVLVFSQVIWDKLSPQEQAWIQQAADESAVLQRKLWAESEKKSLEEVQKAGVKINYPDKAPFIEKVQPLLESYQSNPVIYSYIKRIQAVD